MPRRPPKSWWDRCVAAVARGGKVIDPAKICGATWYKRMSEEARAAVLAAVEKGNEQVRRAAPKPKRAPKRAAPKPKRAATKRPAARKPVARKPAHQSRLQQLEAELRALGLL